MKLMKVFFLALSVCSLVLPWTSLASAKKQKQEFDRVAEGCWERKRDVGRDLYCFDNGKVTAVVIGREEGLESSGIYRAYQHQVVMLGFPGDGWASPNYVDKCDYHFEGTGKVLVLENCGLSGEWTRSKHDKP